MEAAASAAKQNQAGEVDDEARRQRERLERPPAPRNEARKLPMSSMDIREPRPETSISSIADGARSRARNPKRRGRRHQRSVLREREPVEPLKSVRRQRASVNGKWSDWRRATAETGADELDSAYWARRGRERRSRFTWAFWMEAVDR
jgi:hypothetical protein